MKKMLPAEGYRYETGEWLCVINERSKMLGLNRTLPDEICAEMHEDHEHVCYQAFTHHHAQGQPCKTHWRTFWAITLESGQEIEATPEGQVLALDMTVEDFERLVLPPYEPGELIEDLRAEVAEWTDESGKIDPDRLKVIRDRWLPGRDQWE